MLHIGNEQSGNEQSGNRLIFKCFFSNEQNCSLEFSDLYNWLRVNLGVNFRFRATYFLKVLPYIDNDNYTYRFDLKKMFGCQSMALTES